MRAITLACSLTIFFAGLHSSSAANLVKQSDRDIAKKAIVKAVEYCGDLEELDIDDNAKADLEEASGNNWVLRQMKGAKDNKEFEKNMENNMDIGFFIAKGGPLVASLLFIFAYCICCWTACPCCRRCRCCQRKHTVNPVFKLVLFGILCAVVLGIIISASMSRTGFNKAVDGLKHTSCTGSKLLNSTLSGNWNPDFLGLIPTLDVFGELIAALDATSSFLTQLQAVILDTKKIEHSTTLASATMGLLRDMMQASANKRPKTSTGTDLIHDCTLCPQLEAVLTPAIKSLNEGVAMQLNNARSEVRTQLTGEGMTNLQTSIRTATTPLSELMKLFISVFSFIVDKDDLQNFTDNVDKSGLYLVLVLVFMALFISCCACTGMGLWTCRELKRSQVKEQENEIVVGAVGSPTGGPKLAKQKSKLEESMGEGAQKLAAMSTKYKSQVHRCSLCTWCCGCCYLWLAFFVGGLLTALSVPLASVCLLLDDVNGQMLDDIAGVLNSNFSGDSGTIMKDTIDQCFRNPIKTANPALLDIIFTRNATTNEKVTLRTTIVTNTKDMINAKFDGITNSMSNGSSNMSTSPSILTLRKTLRDSRMDAMMAPAATYNWAGSVYSDMSTDTRASNSLSLYYSSSAACADFNVPANMGTLSGQTVKGITSFSGSLAHFGSAVAHSSCAKQVTCSGSSACVAGNKLMKVKQDLRTINTFKCRKFKLNGAVCDVINMVESPVGSGNYQNDCLKSDGTLETKEYACTLDEFTTLVRTFETRLDKVFARLDSASEGTKTKINVEMRGLVRQYITRRIDIVADGLTCGYLNQLYQAFIDGTCYAGVWGFTQISTSYVVCAIFTLFLVILMYIVWRVSIDNYNSNKKVLPA